MTPQRALAAALTGAAVLLCGAAQADPPALRFPVDCRLGQECYIQQYTDLDPGRGARDYRCGPLSYDGHRGTDIAVPTLRDMQRGIDVIAAAPGTVARVRDGMADRTYSDANAETVTGRECGNGVFVDHGNGWETAYCHLANGSVRVRPGDPVRVGTRLGKIGLSGRTQFPHVHFSVFQNGNAIDPFDPDGQVTCGAPSADTMWVQPPAYQPGGLLTVGFSDGVPAYARILEGRAAMAQLTPNAPALVLFGFAFGARAGDQMVLDIRAPGGGTFLNETQTIERTQIRLFRAVGRANRGPWPRGSYIGTVSLIRGEALISQQSVTMRVR